MVGFAVSGKATKAATTGQRGVFTGRVCTGLMMILAVADALSEAAGRFRGPFGCDLTRHLAFDSSGSVNERTWPVSIR
jgi:hypothetical protein